MKPRVRYSFIKILTGSDLSRRRLPYMEASGRRDGPTVWLTACAHGDEVGGVVVISEVFKRLRRSLRSGSVRAFPLMNPLGFDIAMRHVSLSEEDLNRSFPGDPNGSLAERIAALVFGAVVDTAPAAVLDLHNDWIRSIPYVLIDFDVQAPAAALRETRELSGWTGLPIVEETDHLPRSLSYNLVARGIPAVTVELGESYVVNELNVGLGVSAVWGVLSTLGMTDPEPAPPRLELPGTVARRALRYTSRPRSSTSGVIRFMTRAGDVVAAGQPVARVYNAFGKLQETIKATEDSLVLGLSDSAVAFPGAPVIALGVLQQ